MISTPNLGLMIPEEDDIYGIDYVLHNMKIIDAMWGTDAIESAFYSVFTLTNEDGQDPTALSTQDIREAIAATWNGESSTDSTALSAEDVNEALETKWNGESSEDPTALNAEDIADVIK